MGIESGRYGQTQQEFIKEQAWVAEKEEGRLICEPIFGKGGRPEVYQCLTLMVPWGVWKKLEALATVEGVTPKAMAMRLIAEAGEDYYGKALEGED